MRSQNLRVWQREAFELYQRAQPRDFLAVATPGAGKTTFALTVAADLIHRGVVERIVVVTPTDHLKTQWALAARARRCLAPSHGSAARGHAQPAAHPVRRTAGRAGVAGSAPRTHRPPAPLGPESVIGLITRRYRVATMVTLHIEHPIHDFDSWTKAFTGFAEARERAGCVGHRVMRPVDDPKHVVIDLDFGTRDQAEAFLAFLRETVWSSPQNSPALAGAPHTQILDLTDV
ncbi:MAG: DEAD/DEAH box helicase family protein [Aeromicrobium sp.]